MTRYLSGLCVAGLGLCGGIWLVMAAVAFGGETAGRAGRVDLLTGAGLIAACFLSLVCWSFAWRQRMRADGVLADRSAPVSKRAARRNRRALGRDVRRAGKLAGRSARDARRSARRSARAGSSGRISGGAFSEGGVRSAGAGLGSAGLGSALPADEPRTVAVSHGAGANSANGTNGKRVGTHRSGGTNVMNGDSKNGPAGAGGNGSAADGAAELISQLREMLVPLLSASESQPTLGEQAAAAGLPRRTAAAASGSQPALAQPGAAAASGLPRRTPSASAFRPRATVPMPRLESVPVPARPLSVRQRAVPRTAGPAVDDGLGVPVDSEEAWW